MRWRRRVPVWSCLAGSARSPAPPSPGRGAGSSGRPRPLGLAAALGRIQAGLTLMGLRCETARPRGQRGRGVLGWGVGTEGPRSPRPAPSAPGALRMSPSLQLPLGVLPPRLLPATATPTRRDHRGAALSQRTEGIRALPRWRPRRSPEPGPCPRQHFTRLTGGVARGWRPFRCHKVGFRLSR